MKWEGAYGGGGEAASPLLALSQGERLTKAGNEQ